MCASPSRVGPRSTWTAWSIGLASTTIPALVLALWAVASETTVMGAEFLEITVRETAGIRRFQYPVTARVALPPDWPRDASFQLRRGEQPIAAQFTHASDLAREPQSTTRDTESATGELLIDFHVDALPHEELTFQLTTPSTDEPSTSVRPVSRRRITASREDDALTVDANGVLRYRIRNDLACLVESVRIGNDEWLRESSPGWMLESRDGALVRLGSDEFPVQRMTVTRQGSHLCEIAFVASGREGMWRSLRCQGKLVFPLGKSWFEVDCHWEDPEDVLAESRWELDLQLGDPPLLVDFAAGDFVYLNLRTEEQAQLQARPGLGPKPAHWEVFQGKQSSGLIPWGRGAIPAGSPGIWAHLMDRKLCTAIALQSVPSDASAWATTDTLELTAQGGTIVRRRFSEMSSPDKVGAATRAKSASRPESNKSMRGWYHFVYFPPHVTGVTSPQSMLTPLEVSYTTP